VICGELKIAGFKRGNTNCGEFSRFCGELFQPHKSGIVVYPVPIVVLNGFVVWVMVKAIDYCGAGFLLYLGSVVDFHYSVILQKLVNKCIFEVRLDQFRQPKKTYSYELSYYI
jgi:hypothetical protein